MVSKQTVMEQLLATDNLVDHLVDLDTGYCSCRMQSNSTALLHHLEDYFSFVVKPVANPTYTIRLIESEVVDLPSASDNTGEQDSYVELEQGRLIRKATSGMVFLQRLGRCIAVGPCLHNANQVINFICSQMMNWLQQHDWLRCHAAGIVHDGYAYAIASFIDDEQSSLMLTMLEQHDSKFLTNDCLFIKTQAEQVAATGMPEMPRIYPGTIVHHPRLHGLISEAEQQQLRNLPNEQLWQLENKYDVDIERYFGLERIRYQAPLEALLILNWSRDSKEDVSIDQIDLRQRPELLQAVMKSPGPFYQDAKGQFISDDEQLDSSAYLNVLDKIKVFEATGGMDFQTLAKSYLAIAS